MSRSPRGAHNVTKYAKKQDTDAHVCCHSNRLHPVARFHCRLSIGSYGHLVETRLRVRYAETDQMGIVYHANYLIWMEVGRVEYCRAAGIRYRDMERDDGILLVVVGGQLPLPFSGRATTKKSSSAPRSTRPTPRMIRFGYEMLDRDDGRSWRPATPSTSSAGATASPTKLPREISAVFG